MSDPSTIVSGAQTTSDVAPYVQALAGVVISGVGGYVALLVKRYVGVSVSQDVLAKVEGLAMQYASAEIAKAADNLATAQINVKSPMVKTIVDQIATDAPKELDTLGLSPADVANKVVAAFGKLQAGMTTVAVPTQINAPATMATASPK